MENYEETLGRVAYKHIYYSHYVNNMSVIWSHGPEKLYHLFLYLPFSKYILSGQLHLQLP